jgi:hypothetical protein
MISGLQDGEKESVTDKWAHDIMETEKQLTLGARVARRNVKKVLGAVEEDDARADEEVDKGDDDNKENADLNYELHKSLRYAERGVKRMAKGLPQDEI